MKRILIVCLLSLGLSGMSHAAKPMQVKLDKVTVYLQGAHLYYSEPITFVQGNNLFVLEGISPYIQEHTLQASARGVVVTEARHSIRYREAKPKTGRYDAAIARVTDSLEEIEYALRDVQNHLTVLDQEKKMLLGNRLIRGDSPKDSLPLLKQSMEYVREKLNEILAQELRWNKSKDKVNKEKLRLDARLQELQLLQQNEADPEGVQAQPIHQVVVSVFAEQAGQGSLMFNYFVQQAGWSPNYDLQANASNEKIQLRYFANVAQQSGIHWNDASLTLSTSNPLERNVLPVLAQWYIGYQQYKKYKTEAVMSNKALKLAPSRVQTDDAEVSGAEDLSEDKMLTEYIEINENLLRTEYEIKLKYDINSDGQRHQVLIRQQEIPMQMTFAAVPKLSQEAFLLGRISNWEDLQLIPGNARIYFDNSYVGETYLNNNSMEDTLDLNLGKDKTILITRKKVKDKTRSKTLELEKVEMRSIEIAIRNTKSMPVRIRIQDQIPLAQPNSPDIKVTLLDADGAQLDEQTGFLTWNVKVGSKEQKKIVFTYEVRYPKGKVVYGL